MGYALIGLCRRHESGVRGVLIYMAIYLVMTAGASPSCCRCAATARWSRTSPISPVRPFAAEDALGLAIFMFSMLACRRSPASSASCFVIPPGDRGGPGLYRPRA
jgi:NADH-quinone oxidoreductase subunit N